MSKNLQKFKVKKVAGPIEGGAAVFLVNEKMEKAFIVFVGITEAAAIIRELNNQVTIRPLTHDLLYNILIGFDVEVKEVIISKVVDNTFCATIIFEQKILDENGACTGRKNEVCIDSRASDSIVIALKANKEIFVSKEVYDKVENVFSEFISLEEQENIYPWEKFNNNDSDDDDMDFNIPDFPEE